MSDVLTVAEAAQRLRISLPTAYKRIRNGEIPSIRMGRVIRVPVVQLERLLNGETGDAA